MKNIYFLFGILIILIISIQCATIKSSYNIEELCQVIGPTKSIIGLGESTHGTKEFTVYRSQIVKELVQKYNYRVLILEAEYIICAKINDFILSGEGDSKALLKEINLWPWNNKGFLELIHWMRDYNTKHPTDPVYFYGMDSQFYNNYVFVSKNPLFEQSTIDGYAYATIDSILQQYPIEGKSILEIIDNSENPTTKIKTLKALSGNLQGENSNIDLKLQYYILSRIYNIANSEPKDLNARDENMARLIELIHTKSLKKSILWAHNDHIFRENDPESNYISMGYHLSKQFKNEYAVIGFDFKEGTFNAVSQDQKDLQSRRPFQYKPIIETFASQLDYENKQYIITDCTTIKSDFFVNVIGASYKNDPVDVQRYARKVNRNDEFDYIISIEKSTPTEILSAY